MSGKRLNNRRLDNRPMDSRRNSHDRLTQIPLSRPLPGRQHPWASQPFLALRALHFSVEEQALALGTVLEWRLRGQ